MWCFRWRSCQGLSKQDGPKWSSPLSVAQRMSGQWLLFVFVHVVHHRHQNQHLLNSVLELLGLSHEFVAFPPKIFFTAWISKQELCCVYYGFLFWTLMHLGLEFRVDDARGASSVPWLHRECPHSWIWHEAVVSVQLLFSQRCWWPSPALLLPSGGAAPPAWPPCSTRMICFATFFSCSSPLYGKLLSLSLVLPSYT